LKICRPLFFFCAALPANPSKVESSLTVTPQGFFETPGRTSNFLHQTPFFMPRVSPRDLLFLSFWERGNFPPLFLDFARALCFLRFFLIEQIIVPPFFPDNLA